MFIRFWCRIVVVVVWFLVHSTFGSCALVFVCVRMSGCSIHFTCSAKKKERRKKVIQSIWENSLCCYSSAFAIVCVGTVLFVFNTFHGFSMVSALNWISFFLFTLFSFRFDLSAKKCEQKKPSIIFFVAINITAWI